MNLRNERTVQPELPLLPAIGLGSTVGQSLPVTQLLQITPRHRLVSRTTRAWQTVHFKTSGHHGRLLKHPQQQHREVTDKQSIDLWPQAQHEYCNQSLTNIQGLYNYLDRYQNAVTCGQQQHCPSHLSDQSPDQLAHCLIQQTTITTPLITRFCQGQMKCNPSQTVARIQLSEHSPEQSRYCFNQRHPSCNTSALVITTSCQP